MSDRNSVFSSVHLMADSTFGELIFTVIPRVCDVCATGTGVDVRAKIKQRCNQLPVLAFSRIPVNFLPSSNNVISGAVRRHLHCNP